VTPGREFRAQLRSDTKAFASIFPAGPLLLVKGALLAKLTGLFGGGGGGAAAGAGGGGWRRGWWPVRAPELVQPARGAGAAGAGAAGAGAAGAGAAAAGSTAAIGGAAAAGGAAAGGGAAAAAGWRGRSDRHEGCRGLATAAIIAGGAAEIQNVSDHPSAKAPPAKHKVDRGRRRRSTSRPRPTHCTGCRGGPDASSGSCGGHHAAAAGHGHGPAPADRPSRDPRSSDGRHDDHDHRQHHHHKNAVANSDSQPKSPEQTGPVTTGVEPATCDADGDGVTDPGAPSTCTSPPAPTPVKHRRGRLDRQGSVKPLSYSAPKKHKSAPKKRSRR